MKVTRNVNTYIDVDVDLEMEFDDIEEFVKYHATVQEKKQLRSILAGRPEPDRDDLDYLEVVKRNIMDELAIPVIQELLNRFGAEEILTRIHKSS